MAFFTKYTTSIFGRRLGLQALSSAERGGALKADVLVGAEGVRQRTSTAESTAVNLPAYGVSVLDNSSAGSSQIWYLAPPVPGMNKTIVFESTASTLTVKTAGSEFIKSSQGTTMSALHSTQLQYAAVTLVPESTGAWAVLGSLSSAFLRASTST